MIDLRRAYCYLQPMFKTATFITAMYTTVLLITTGLSGCSNWPHQEKTIAVTTKVDAKPNDTTGTKTQQTHDAATIENGRNSKSILPTKLNDALATSNVAATGSPSNISTTTAELKADTLADLMLAEMAGKQNRLDVTLGNYIKQAHQTREPEIIARAAHIAQYINANQASLDMAKLWHSVEPNNVDALQLLTLHMIRLMNFDQAVRYMDQLLAMKAQANFDFLVVQASQLDKTQRNAVIQSIDQLLQKYPNEAQLWFTKALLSEQNEEHALALQQINASLNIEPDAIAAIMFKATILVKKQQTNDALKLLKKTVKRHPDNKRLGIVYARLLIQDNQLQQAQRQFADLVKRNPEDSDLLLTLALLSIENKLYDQAKNYLHQLIDQKQKVNEAYLYLGQIATAEADHKKAINYYQLISESQQYGPAQIAIAELLTKDNQLESARTLLKNARLKQPAMAIPFYIYEAELLINTKQGEPAKALLTSALLTHSQNVDLLYTRAMLYADQQQYQAMENDLRKILEIDANNGMALNALGYTLADRGERLEEAIGLIKKALALKPNDAAILDSLGWAYFKKGDLSTAQQYLQKAYQIMQDDEIAAHLGEVLWMSGHQQQAKRIWRAALKNKPDSKPLQQTMQRFLQE
jgi:tetratricopeptide (TPR) repeat protein